MRCGPCRSVRNRSGTSLTAGMPEFWFMMQLAMLAGFLTSYPANAVLIGAGIKESM